MSRFDGDDALPDGPWSRWWCRSHRRNEDPGLELVVALCTECGHVHHDNSAVIVLEGGRLCEFCLTALGVF